MKRPTLGSRMVEDKTCYDVTDSQTYILYVSTGMSISMFLLHKVQINFHNSPWSPHVAANWTHSGLAVDPHSPHRPSDCNRRLHNENSEPSWKILDLNMS